MLDTAVEMEQRIRQRAYFIWQYDGCPSGHADDHWRRAREVEEELHQAADHDEGIDVYQHAILNADGARPLYAALIEASGDIALSDDEFETLTGLVQSRAGNQREAYRWTSLPDVTPLYVDDTGLAVVFHKDEEGEVYIHLMKVTGEFGFLDNPSSSTTVSNTSA